MKPHYCIIGAGYCGLGVSKAFLDAGISFDCLEKNNDVGGNWLNGVYDSTHLISSRDTTQYGDFPMPRDYPDFPSRDQVLNYLRTYADTFKLRSRIEFSAEVVKITPLDPNGLKGWQVELADGETRFYTGVVVANGHHWSKRLPKYPGEFSGKMLHSKDYKNPKDFQGDRVLVVGAGNSGCDIAVEAGFSGLQSWISMRRGYYFLPKTVFGIPTAEIDRAWFPGFAQKMVLKAYLKLTNGSNERYGIPKPDHDLFEHHPIVNSQLLYFIRHGKVKPKPDISRFEGKIVHFVDGTQLEIDTLIWATGFNVSFPFLDSAFFEWENGYPKRIAGMLAPHLAGLYIFGVSQPRGGAGPLVTRGSALLAEMVLAQEKLDHPIGDDIVRFKSADARILVGVRQLQREITLGRFLIKRIVKNQGREKRAKRVSAQPLEKAASGPLKSRNYKFAFNEEIPKNWVANNPLHTHLINSLNLLFPAGERYFIRAVRHYADCVKDPELKEKLSGFFAQEVQHGREHERFFEILRGQGFEIESFLYWYQKIFYEWMEPATPLKIRLSKTAALEHYTAALADFILRERLLAKHAHPTMADFFHWHAAEEIEHKSVAFDVLQAAGSSYPTRMIGLLWGSLSLGSSWLAGTILLLRQDPEFTLRTAGSLARSEGSKESIVGMLKCMTRAFFQYVKPGFHPSQIENFDLAQAALQDLEKKYPRDLPPVSDSKEAELADAPPTARLLSD